MVATSAEYYETVNEVLDTACELVEIAEQGRTDEEMVRVSTNLGIVVRKYRQLKKQMEGDIDGVPV